MEAVKKFVLETLKINTSDIATKSADIETQPVEVANKSRLIATETPIIETKLTENKTHRPLAQKKKLIGIDAEMKELLDEPMPTGNGYKHISGSRQKLVR